MRYDLIHYIYTMFYECSSEASPLVRAMWFEYPADETVQTLDTQFMFGQSILVCPKVQVPDNEQLIWTVSCTFPVGSTWYYWYNRVAESKPSGVQSVDLPDSEQGIWVRGGSILPILQHTTEMSLLHALGNDISLEVYPDANQFATGKLYMDDGQTFAHQKDCEKTLVNFGFFDQVLYIQRQMEDDCRFDGAEQQRISKVTIYDVSVEPESIKLKTSGDKVAFTWNDAEKSVTIDDLDFTVDTADSKFGERRDLLEIRYKSDQVEITQ